MPSAAMRSGAAAAVVSGAIAALVSGAIAALLFASTLQWQINGSADPYATDIGEIQNALPRWGTLHFTGYPLYSVTGSAAVSALRIVGIEPAAGASIVSLVWGAVAIGLLAALAVAVGAHPAAAVGGALIAAVAKSMWLDASVAEVHTLTMAFTFAVMLLGVQYRRLGGRRLLLLLAFVFAQGILHMRPLVFLVPAVAVLVWPRRGAIAREWRSLIAIGVLSPLVYLYMPLREWMGATWTFGETDTWRGFWTMLLDTKAERIVQPISGVGELAERGLVIARLLHDDLPAPIIALGLTGLLAAKRAVALALTLAWIPYAAITLVIWEGRVSDALLAVKLPVVLFACVGLALAATVGARALGSVAGRSRGGQAVAADGAGAVAATSSAAQGAGAVAATSSAASARPTMASVASLVTAAGLVIVWVAVGYRNYPEVVAVSHDYSLEPMLELTDHALQNPARRARPKTGVDDALQGPASSERLAPPFDASVTLLAPWGHTYWALAYEQEYGDRLNNVRLVDHNADLAVENVILTRFDTFYVFPQQWWEERLGPVGLQAFSPELVQVVPQARYTEGVTESRTGGQPGTSASTEAGSATRGLRSPFRVNSDLELDDAFARRGPDGSVEVYLEWQALVAPVRDYSVAVHLVEAGVTTAQSELKAGDIARGATSDIEAEAVNGRIVDQADSAHPVFGWSPTSTWPAGATVRDAYRLHPPPAEPGVILGDLLVRVTAYHTIADGDFVNGEWLILPVPQLGAADRRTDE